MPKSPPPFRIVLPTALTFHAEGALYGDVDPRSIRDGFRIHTLRIKPIRGSRDVSKALPVGTTATRWIIEGERRQEERELWRRFLAIDEATSARQWGRLTHTLTWGYWLSDGSYIQLLVGSFSFAIPGYDTKTNAIRCGEFLVDFALQQKVLLDGFDNLIQHQSLTSTKVANRINWLTLLFMRYLWLARGDV